MKKNKLDFLDDDFDKEPTPSIEYIDLFEYVVKNKKFKLELTEFFVIENGFRECWNSNSGELIGDGEFKNYVYRHIEKELTNKTIPKRIPQKKVDMCIDLILKYLISIGQYDSDFSKN